MSSNDGARKGKKKEERKGRRKESLGQLLDLCLVHEGGEGNQESESRSSSTLTHRQ